jgi:hypothetical protein
LDYNSPSPDYDFVGDLGDAPNTNGMISIPVKLPTAKPAVTTITDANASEMPSRTLIKFPIIPNAKTHAASTTCLPSQRMLTFGF